MPTAEISGISAYYEVTGSGPPLLMMAPGGFDSTLEKWSTSWPWRHFLPLQSLARRDIVMEQGGIRPHRFQGIEDRWQRLVVNIDKQERLFGGFRRLRCDSGNPVTNVANPVPAEDRQVPKDFSHVETDVVLTGYHGLDAGYVPGC